jgi:hypothetical protein
MEVPISTSSPSSMEVVGLVTGGKPDKPASQPPTRHNRVAQAIRPPTVMGSPHDLFKIAR